jgi:hypothetical protein
MNLTEYRALVKRSKKRLTTARKQEVSGAFVKSKGKGPNATEESFNRDILGGRGLFEAMSFKIAGGHRYTPDFIVQTRSGIEAYEIKGSYRFPSEGRARLAFDDAKERYPSIKFYWYRKNKSGWRDET